ncbi:MAG: phage protease [Thermodesulfobacteriota bacterium]
MDERRWTIIAERARGPKIDDLGKRRRHAPIFLTHPVITPLDALPARIPLAVAANSGEIPAGCDRLALNFELPADGSVPEWLELIPPGQVVAGRDGRTWLNDKPDGIVVNFKASGIDLPLDWNHATELQAPQGLPAPAAAWGKELQLREGGAVWGRFEWTAGGRASVEAREYRYISPVLIYEKASGRIVGINSVGLVNKPNLALPALNHQSSIKEDKTMFKKLLALLGLEETATEEQAMNAVTKIKSDLQTALNRAETPSLDKFVPRADYDAALGRATNAEKTLADRDKADLETKVVAAVDGAIKDGKVVPASRDYYLAMCRQKDGLAEFEKFLKTAPVIAKGSELDTKKPGGDGLALNAEQAKIAAIFGNTAEDLKKYGLA